MVQKLFSEERVKKALGYHRDCCFQEKCNLPNTQSVILPSCRRSEELLETNHTYGDMALSLAWAGDKSPYITGMQHWKHLSLGLMLRADQDALFLPPVLL